jgi:DNA-binding MarR family transcriptional regulator
MMRFLTLDNINGFSFLQVPVSLIESASYRDLSSNDRIIYSVLNRRAQMSARNPSRFVDKDGHVFIRYTIAKMSEYLRISENTVKKAFKSLEDAELIHRVEEPDNKTNFKKFYRIYVLVPKDERSDITDVMNDEIDDEEECEQSNIDPSMNFREQSKIDPSDRPKIDPSKHQKMTSSNKETSKQETSKKDQNIAERFGSDTLKSKTLFDLPEIPVERSPIEIARETGDWRKVTDTEFLKYFIAQQNKLFPTQIQFVRSKNTNQIVSLLRKNFIERHQIAQEDVCDAIDTLIETYKKTESDPRYVDCFALETFFREWKIDNLMKAVKLAKRYGPRDSSRQKSSEKNDREIF